MTKRGETILNELLTGRERACALGAGRANLPLIRWFSDHGVKISVRDEKREEDIEVLSELRRRKIALTAGPHWLDGISEKYVFRSPGIRPDRIRPGIIRPENVMTEAELYLELTKAHTVGVTGSDGKTTTSSMIAAILNESQKRRVLLGGNIGKPLFPTFEDGDEHDYAVLELSSFQLMDIRRGTEIAVLTNLSENHLNWHRSFDEYRAAKLRVFSPPCRVSVLNASEERTPIPGFDGETRWFSASGDDGRGGTFYTVEGGDFIRRRDGKKETLFPVSVLSVPGTHNVANALSAIAATDGIATAGEMERALSAFAGVAHRIETVCVRNGVTYIDSSIDTTPTRTRATLAALRYPSISLILGGRDKGTSFLPLADAIDESNVDCVTVTGEAADTIASALENRKKRIPVCVVPDFAEAVKTAADHALPGGCVLLSPACASFDVFRDFEERGNVFRALVTKE